MKLKIEDEEKIEESWDIKKIIIGALILITFFGIGFFYLFNLFTKGDLLSKRALGVSTKKEKEVPPLPSKDDISRIITSAQESLSQITYENVTSSQAAIQKIIKDLNFLEGKNENNFICQFICKDK